MPTPFVKNKIKTLESVLGTQVSFTANGSGRGSLKITFESQEKLEHILNSIEGVS